MIAYEIHIDLTFGSSSFAAAFQNQVALTSKMIKRIFYEFCSVQASCRFIPTG